jgi:hypothetical protein
MRDMTYKMHPKMKLKLANYRKRKSIEREKTFYRGLLEQVCQDGRKTRARRLAESGLMFWDSMQAEKSKRSNEKADLPPTGARQPRSGTETTNGG